MSLSTNRARRRFRLSLRPCPYDYLAYENKVYGTNMNSEQVGTLIILHELRHQDSLGKATSNAETVAANTQIITNCVNSK